MNMKEMDTIARIQVASDLTGALRHATIIEGLINARYTARNIADMNQIITRHENWLHEHLARVASMLGLALVDKAGLEPDTNTNTETEAHNEG
jgi:hypothetical protein